jgi:hypothetical protein
MQTPLPTTTARQFPGSRLVATIAAATVAAGGVALIAATSNDDSVTRAPIRPALGIGGVADKPSDNGAIVLRRSGLVIPERISGVQPSTAQRAAAEQFHHFR